MAFNRLAPEDFVISSDSITATLWSEGAVALTKFQHIINSRSWFFWRFLLKCISNYIK
jgi:hypothetical protein